MSTAKMAFIDTTSLNAGSTIISFIILFIVIQWFSYNFLSILWYLW